MKITKMVDNLNQKTLTIDEYTDKKGIARRNAVRHFNKQDKYGIKVHALKAKILIEEVK